MTTTTKSACDNKIGCRRATAIMSTTFGLALLGGACTPATPESTGTGGSASNASGGSSTSPAGSGGAVGSGSGGAVGSASGGSTGSGGAATGSSGGAVGSGGSVGSGGATTASSGGAVGRGGSTGAGTGGATAAGGSNGAATGCNWVHNTGDDTWAMSPAAAEKVVLFDGTSLNQWHVLNMPNQVANWRIIPGQAVMEVVPVNPPTNIQSNMKFEDVCVHVEYMTPVFKSGAMTQEQGNSGVYLKSAYEMQILDTHLSPPLIDGCGAVYFVAPPLVVACNQYLVWNTYEIEFKSSVWDNSTPRKKTKDAVFVQVALNGKIVQRNVSLNPNGGFTQAGIADVAGPQPLALQDHRETVQFRNIWVTIPKY